jgi:hypothetical protein
MRRNFSDWDGWQFRDNWAATMRYGQTEVPFWDRNSVRSLLVIGEQGIGDELLFASVLPEAMTRAEQVTYCGDERLAAPLARSLPGLITKTRHVDARDDILAGFDAFVPAADLLPMFRQSAEHFPRKPFLKPDPSRLEEFGEYRGMTGISWKGRHGSVNPDCLPTGMVNLQYDDTHPNFLETGIDLRDDIEGVIALCSVLSRVVSVPASAWHIAAATGTQVDVYLADAGTEQGVIDEIDWHVPLGPSPYWGGSTVYAT